jgi:uncharacterized protein
MKILACCLLLLFQAVAARDAKPDDLQSFNQWKDKLVGERKKEWLPLAGLFWLKQGQNVFGSDPKNPVVFPKGPAHAGTFLLNGKDVTLKLEPGANAIVAGKKIATANLASGLNPTIVEMGSLRFKVIVRGERVGIRLKDSDSEAARKYAGPVFFPWNGDYRIMAKWNPSDGKRTVDVPNVLGDVTPTPILGTAVFSRNGQELHLTAIAEEGSDELFFIFNDLTSKTATYPGGRFLKASLPTQDAVLLDFNRAYSPPCAVTAYATCPLAPRENRLGIAIEAGEKYDRAHAHH